MGFFFQEADGVGKATEKISEGLTDIGKKLGQAFKDAIDPSKIMDVIINVDNKRYDILDELTVTIL